MGDMPLSRMVVCRLHSITAVKGRVGEWCIQTGACKLG